MTRSTDDARERRPRRGLLGRAPRVAGSVGVSDPRTTDTEPDVLLVIATPCADALRATLHAVPAGTDLTVLLRVPSGHGMEIPTDLACVALRAGARLHEWYGPRERVVPSVTTLLALVPDIASRRLIVRGPRGFTRRTIAAARRTGAG